MLVVSKSIFCIAVSLVLVVSVGTATADDVVPLNKYSGVIRQDPLKQLAPAAGVVVNPQKLAELWQAWSVDAKLPQVDFQTHMVLVDTVPGPNRSFSGPLKLENGDLTYSVASTRMGGPGFGYLMMIVPRKDIKTVNGKPVPAAEPPNQPEPIQPGDSIMVEMVGTIQTGVNAIGGETTGYTITSNGVTWELDFSAAAQIKLAKSLESDQRKVRVSGTLNRISGVEIQQRFIVSVTKIADAALPQPPASQPSVGRPIPEPRSVAIERPQSPADQPDQPQATPESESPPLDMSQLKGFRTIKITMSSESLAGRVTQEVQPNGISSIDDGSSKDRYVIPPERLKQLHDFVQQTNWAEVPRNTRGKQAKPIKFDIEIRAPAGIYRLFIEGDRLQDVEEIADLFRLLRKV
jgi:hypothetical protein